MGAFEETNGSLAPGEVSNVRWTSGTTLAWDAAIGAVEYHVYRGSNPVGYSNFGVCEDTLDGDRTDLSLSDPGMPPVGTAWFYFLSAEDVNGFEGTLGFAEGAERSNFNPCP